MPLYNYKCPEGHTFEELNSVKDRLVAKCPECATGAQMEVSAPHLDYYNMGVQSGFPTALQKWARMHRKEARREYD